MKRKAGRKRGIMSLVTRTLGERRGLECGVGSKFKGT